MTGADDAALSTPPVTVATLTYRRPDDLREALPALVAQVLSVPGAELLVIDNDTTSTARQVVEEAGASAPVRYVHEPRPGIAAARNRALDECRTPLIVFIDDDERPGDGWLSHLVATYQAYPCAGVVGPVVSAFDGDVDSWIRAGRFFERLRHPTGTVVTAAATNNLLLDLAVVREHGLRFDEQFGLSGGSDTVFTLELAARGGRLVWCDEAPVVDVVPPSRNTRAWVSRRAFRMGNSRSRATVHVARGTGARAAARATSAVQGAGRVAIGGARALGGRILRREQVHARGTRTFLRGAGMLLGAFGYVYKEYRRAA